MSAGSRSARARAGSGRRHLAPRKGSGLPRREVDSNYIVFTHYMVAVHEAWRVMRQLPIPPSLTPEGIGKVLQELGKSHTDTVQRRDGGPICCSDLFDQ